jgi:hypothetical protein
MEHRVQGLQHSELRDRFGPYAMKWSRSFWGVVGGAVLCLAGLVGIVYFLYFPEAWGGSKFWQWMPISVFAVGLGILLLFTVFIVGLIREFI